MSSPEPSSSDRAPFCTHAFPPLWQSFLATFTDTLLARGPTATRLPLHALPPPPPTHLPAAERLVAVGDLHGDLEKAQRAFRLAGLTDKRGRWAGGTTVAVQVGDVLDRGDEEIEIWYMLERLQKEAAAAGGALHILNGNHETMNVAGQFRYATPGGYAAFKRWAMLAAQEAALIARCEPCLRHYQQQQSRMAMDLRTALDLRNADGQTARVAALKPGSGPLSRRFIAPNPAVLQIGSTVFVHGGLLPEHVYDIGLERLNFETHRWVLHDSPDGKPKFLSGRDAIVWTRHYSAEDEARCDCEKLQHALRGIPGASRMVVGHTIQEAGINAACAGRVLRVDVGLSKGCGDGAPEVLEITKDEKVRRVQEAAAIKAALKAGAGVRPVFVNAG
jgi:hypothetical protein